MMWFVGIGYSRPKRPRKRPQALQQSVVSLAGESQLFPFSYKELLDPPSGHPFPLDSTEFAPLGWTQWMRLGVHVSLG